MSTTTKSTAMSMEEFLSTPTVEYRRVPGTAPGRFLCIGSLSAGDVIEWAEANEEAKTTVGLRLVVKSLVDGIPGEDEGATGARIGSDKHIAAMKTVSRKVIERIVDAVLDLNGMTPKQEKAAKN